MGQPMGGGMAGPGGMMGGMMGGGMMQGGGMMSGGGMMGGMGMGMAAGQMGGGHTGEASRAWYMREDLFSDDWKAVWQWTPMEVARWVGVIEGLEPYANNFIVNEIDGLKLLAMGTGMDGGEAMMMCGIVSMGARAKFMDEVNFIKKYGVSKHMHRYVTGEDLHSTNIITGLWDGIVGELMYGVLEGIAAPIFQPAKGVRVDGADGFYEGLPAGLAGIVVNPVNGVLECTRKISQGIKNTPQIFDSDQEKFDYMRQKVLRERKEKQNRRQRGKKDKPPVTMDDDYATNPVAGVVQGVRRCGMQTFLGASAFVTEPVKGMQEGGGRGLVKGLTKGTLSLVCRPTSGVIDLVERTCEGLLLFPGALLDSCQKVDEEYKALRKSPWALKAGTTQDLVSTAEDQLQKKMMAAQGGMQQPGGIQGPAAPGGANFT
jgi:hypothetical protein